MIPAEDTFTYLKHRFTTAPILATFNPAAQVILETDASDYAIGTCLSQKDKEGKLRPIAFYSRKFTPPELNYEIHDKELLAIVEAFQQYRVYLEGSEHPILVYTDHKNLLYFTTTKTLNRRQARWSLLLSSYNFTITYRPGAHNTKADALSRRADYIPQNAKEERPPLLRLQDERITYNPTAVGYLSATLPQDLEDRVRSAYQDDSVTQSILKELEKGPVEHFTLSEDGLLLFRNLIFIPNKKELRIQIIKLNHDELTAGHYGLEKTIERIMRNYYFYGLRSTVEQYIATCQLCQQSKTARHAPYGFLKPLPVPQVPYEEIALDFIVKLPKSYDSLTKTAYDSILVVTDRLTKRAHFIPYLEGSSAEVFTDVFLRYIYADHGLSRFIITDRGSVFTSEFFRTLTKRLGVSQKLSTSFHPQTDGQTERLNQTLEQYLRIYVNYMQNNWVQLLPVAQFAYNNAITATTKVTPFYASYGLHPQPHYEPIRHSLRSTSRSAVEFSDRIKSFTETCNSTYSS